MLSLRPRPFVLSLSDMHVCAATVTRSYLTTVCVLFCFRSFGGGRFSRVFLYRCRFLYVHGKERMWYVLTFRMVLFYLVTTGWVFGVSLLRDNSIDRRSPRGCCPKRPCTAVLHDCTVPIFCAEYCCLRYKKNVVRWGVRVRGLI